jgi:arsenate reductase
MPMPCSAPEEGLMDALIYHNPACGTSRNTLALLRHAGVQPRIVEYVTAPPSRDELLALVRDAGIPLREAVREKDLGKLGLAPIPADAGDDALLDLLMANPRLIQRPFVRTPLGVRLARPPERVLELLPPIDAPFPKEDGEVVPPRR